MKMSASLPSSQTTLMQLSNMGQMTDLGHVLSLALGGVLLLLGKVARLRTESWTSVEGVAGGSCVHLQSIAVLRGANLGGLEGGVRRGGQGAMN
jgi:hypothetical protein